MMLAFEFWEGGKRERGTPDHSGGVYEGKSERGVLGRGKSLGPRTQKKKVEIRST